jgi:hypothetical protein
MAGNEWQGGLNGPIAMHGMKIGVANATGIRLDQNLPNTGRRNFQFPKHQRSSELFDNRGVHGEGHN